MSWLLDTNACIRYLNGKSPALKQRVETAGESNIVVCSVVRGELRYGAARSRDPERAWKLQQEFLAGLASLPFDDRAADFYGDVRAALAARGEMIGPNDLLIAAIALAHGVTLVTNNVAEFGRVAGLRVEDWEAEP